MSGSGARIGAGFALAIGVVAGCKFPALPDLPEDGGADTAEIDTPIVDAIDGSPAIDAIDAPPVRGPLVTNGQAADLVLGQPSFGTNSDRGVTAHSFRPEGIAFDAGRLWVADYFRHRVLGWNTPTASDQAATYVLGQNNFTTGTGTGPSATTMFQPAGVVAVGGRVMVLDEYNRVLVWRQPPSAPAAPADFVLGQVDFAGSAPGNGLAQMRVPNWGWSDGSRLLVRGAFTAFRIWSWSTFPDATATPANHQLLSGLNPTDREFGSVGGITSDGQRLVIADTLHNRVMIWNTIPTVSGEPADIVLGQATFTTEAAGSSATSMSAPEGVLIVDGALIVADSGNDRVVVFDPIPTTSGASATQVLGQTSTSSVVLDATPSDRTLNQPNTLAVAGRKLFVGDYNNRRVLRYDLALP